MVEPANPPLRSGVGSPPASRSVLPGVGLSFAARIRALEVGAFIAQDFAPPPSTPPGAVSASSLRPSPRQYKSFANAAYNANRLFPDRRYVVRVEAADIRIYRVR